jgi:myo-inositol-1(or 4)-monophosphatase
MPLALSACLSAAELQENEAIARTAELAARSAGKIMREKLGADVVATKAGDKDLVTLVDGECEASIRSIVSAAHPAHSFLGEESVAPGADASALALAACENDSVLWVVDPIDGTTNFASGIPLSAVSIGVARRGQLIAAVIYDPYRDELFSAVSGGAGGVATTRLNGAPVRVSRASRMREAVVATGSPPNPKSMSPALRGVVAISPHVRTLRMLGSAAIMMAWVACGRLDAYWEPDLNAWDTAAGALLIRGAGGRVTGLDGEEYELSTRTLLCANGEPSLHREILEALLAADVRGLDP